MKATKSVTQAMHIQHLKSRLPWTKPSPLIISAPMRIFTGPHLALAVSRAGGIGFIGPGETPESTLTDLQTVKSLLTTQPLLSDKTSKEHYESLPVGVGFQLWNGDLATAARALREHKPAAAWLFAPRNGQPDIDAWTTELRAASPATMIWLQVGTLAEALAAAASASRPDVLVLQGAEAGGHGRAEDGVSLITLLPETADALARAGWAVPLVAAGGVADGRGAAAALALGAAGVAMGTRFLASREARISHGYQAEVIRASDGAVSTVRTQLYNHLRGTFGWPAQWSPRGLWNRSWVEHKDGVEFEQLKRRHDEAAAKGDEGWGPEGRLATYAGASVGLIKTVSHARDIVEGIREEVASIVTSLGAMSLPSGSDEE